MTARPTCGGCPRFDPCDLEAYGGVGICVQSRMRARTCRSCGDRVYTSEVSYEWTTADADASDCDWYGSAL